MSAKKMNSIPGLDDLLPSKWKERQMLKKKKRERESESTSMLSNISVYICQMKGDSLE